MNAPAPLVSLWSARVGFWGNADNHAPQGCQKNLKVPCNLIAFELALVFERRQSFQYFGGFGPIQHQIVLANTSISKYQNAFGKLRDVVFVSN